MVERSGDFVLRYGIPRINRSLSPTTYHTMLSIDIKQKNNVINTLAQPHGGEGGGERERTSRLEGLAPSIVTGWSADGGLC